METLYPLIANCRTDNFVDAKVRSLDFYRFLSYSNVRPTLYRIKPKGHCILHQFHTDSWYFHLLLVLHKTLAIWQRRMRFLMFRTCSKPYKYRCFWPWVATTTCKWHGFGHEPAPYSAWAEHCGYGAGKNCMVQKNLVPKAALFARIFCNSCVKQRHLRDFVQARSIDKAHVRPCNRFHENSPCKHKNNHKKNTNLRGDESQPEVEKRFVKKSVRTTLFQNASGFYFQLHYYLDSVGWWRYNYLISDWKHPQSHR